MSARRWWRSAAAALLAAALAIMTLAPLPGCGDSAPNPQNGASLEQGRKAYATGFFVEAEKHFQQVLEAPGPDARWEAWNRLVDIAMAQRGDPRRAVVLLSSMRAEYGADPVRLAQVLSRLGDAYTAMGLHKLAVDSWAQAEAVPGVGVAERLNLTMRQGRSWRTQGRFGRALECAGRCAELAGPKGLGDAKAAAACDYERALTLSFTDRFAEARPILERLVRDERMAAEDRGVAAFLLADILARQNLFSLARQLLTAIRPAHPNPMAVDARLRALDEEERASSPAKNSPPPLPGRAARYRR